MSFSSLKRNLSKALYNKLILWFDTNCLWYFGLFKFLKNNLPLNMIYFFISQNCWLTEKSVHMTVGLTQ